MFDGSSFTTLPGDGTRFAPAAVRFDWALDDASLRSGSRVLAEQDGRALLAWAKIDIRRVAATNTRVYGVLQRALWDAVDRGDKGAIRTLLNAGVQADWEADCEGKPTPFETAIRHLAEPPSVNEDYLLRAFYDAPVAPFGSCADYEACARMLLAATPYPIRFINRVVDRAPRNKPKEPLLHSAAAWGHVEKTRLLLALGADPLLKFDGRTAHTSAREFNEAEDGTSTKMGSFVEPARVQECINVLIAAESRTTPATSTSTAAAPAIGPAPKAAQALAPTAEAENLAPACAAEVEERRAAWIKYYLQHNMVAEAMQLGWVPPH